MNDGYMWWLVLVGLVVGVALTWLSVVRLPRHDYDIGTDEREEEAVRMLRPVFEANPGWVELLKRLPAAGLFPDDGELIAFCKTQMAGVKVPREIRRVEVLPRNALGKIQKHLL